MLTRLRMLAATAAGAVALMFAIPAQADAPGTIVEVASSAGTFKTLVAAVKAAGLAGTLSGAGPTPFLRPPTRRSPSCPPARSTAC